jgi:hypothetical protein
MMRAPRRHSIAAFELADDHLNMSGIGHRLLTEECRHTLGLPQSSQVAFDRARQGFEIVTPFKQ